MLKKQVGNTQIIHTSRTERWSFDGQHGLTSDVVIFKLAQVK